MEVFAAGEAKRAFGLVMDSAQREPVLIEKKGRPFAVVLSKHDYDAMQAALQDYRSEKETQYLMSTPANRERLTRSIEQSRRGENLIEKTIEELRSYED